MNKRLEREKIQMNALKGINHQIIDNSYDPLLAVTCDNGTFVGNKINGVLSYKGIPYALPPVGNLRWKPPVDATENEGVYEAYYFGKSGIQTEAESERASLYYIGEDCLTLNVWTAPGDKPKTVMVFFPGGAYGWGGTADPLYDGQKFVEAHRDIVLVTVNYRIGLMGFMDFSALEGGEEYQKSGNLGLLDQISALRWVKRNIEHFGGDPSNVTIFGESAGASSVSLLPLIAEAKGLFKRVIAESGSIAFTYSRQECQKATQMLIKETGATCMDNLLALTEEQLIKINKKLNDYNNFPERDGIVLPLDVYDAYASGMGSDIEMLTGTNKDEARYWINEVGDMAVYRIAAPLLYYSIVERLNEEDQHYPKDFIDLQYGDEPWKKTEFFNDLIFRIPALTQAEYHSSNGGKNYFYYWAKESSLPNLGACHAVELAYVFNNLNDTIYTGSPADKKLAETVQEMWVNFAKTGDPSTQEHHWKPYDSIDRFTMVLDDEIREEKDILKEQRLLVEPLMKYRFNGYYMMVDYALMYLKKLLVKGLKILVAVEISIDSIALLRKLLFRKDQQRNK